MRKREVEINGEHTGEERWRYFFLWTGW